MSLERVREFVSRYPDLQIILFETSTHTADLAAQALGVTPAQIAKTLVFLADGQPVLVVTCGDKKINTKKLATELEVKKIRFADAQKVEEATGFLPGGVSPIGLISEIPLFLDKSLWDFDIVYAAAGTDNSALPVSPDRLCEITGAKVIDVCC
ncbi:YbaK/EbsC family protein [Pelosinus propionicus]|uniref:Cys-tRNA(Pro) deacylase n=1 Tax=Pelosinus propionicus DSM 13327 TaxID=1123291 RepID=A0A1I4LUS5_9FIRM|nr:YbaK/EbsC family protein [Pelosinus propionicus]SFL94679.1 Cys-tRNA(Pro) deacylase [Pelosinus propionicus DSM 13327]